MAVQQEYKHSGAPGAAAVLVPEVGSLGALVRSFLYGYISVYNPPWWNIFPNIGSSKHLF